MLLRFFGLLIFSLDAYQGFVRQNNRYGMACHSSIRIFGYSETKKIVLKAKTI